MRVWKTAALVALSGMVIVAGAWSTPSVEAQSSDSAPVAHAFEMVGRGAQIGVTVRDVENDDAKQTGVIVDEVRSGSPAEKAGIKAGDAIVEFDGERVRSVRQFTRLVHETPAGRKVTAVVTRNGSRTNVTVAPERSSGVFPADSFDFEEFADGVRSWAYKAPPRHRCRQGPRTRRVRRSRPTSITGCSGEADDWGFRPNRSRRSCVSTSARRTGCSCDP